MNKFKVELDYKFILYMLGNKSLSRKFIKVYLPVYIYVKLTLTVRKKELRKK